MAPDVRRYTLCLENSTLYTFIINKMYSLTYTEGPFKSKAHAEAAKH